LICVICLCLINRVHSYQITNEAETEELNIIQDTLHNEYSNKNLSISHSRNHKHNKNASQQHHTTNWATFTYYRKETKEITKMLKETNIKIAYWTKSTIQNLVKPCLQWGEYEESGIYQMRCMDCPLKYIGQTGRTFKTRCKEHIQAIGNNNGNLGYSSIHSVSRFC
jgi:hypothetical protein